MNIRQLFAAVLITIACSTAQAQPLISPSNNLNDCAHHAPWGFPQVNILDHTNVCRSGYALQLDNQARVAAWVTYVLTAQQVTSCGDRPERFEPDPLVPSRARATPQDYARSGWDQGHLAPNADQSWHPRVQQESFYLSNVAPQHPTLNRQLWNQLEQSIRAWAFEMGALHVTTGVVYKDSVQTVGFRQIAVPTHFYKIVTHVESGRTWAFLAPNTVTNHRVIRQIQTSVAEIQQLSGVRFSQPDNPRLMRQLIPTNTRAYNQARQASCSQNR